MRKAITSVAGAKILLAKTNWSFQRNLHFSENFPHIVYASLATQHARCHKEYYSPRGQAVSTSHITLQEDKPSLRVTSEYLRSAPFLRKQSDFAILRVLNPSEFALFHEISSSDTYHGCNHANLGLNGTCSISYGSN